MKRFAYPLLAVLMSGAFPNAAGTRPTVPGSAHVRHTMSAYTEPDGEEEKAGRDSLLLVFWNIENFFDYRSEAKPQKYWTARRFYRKCEDISKVLLSIADKYGRIPDAVGFAEVENRFAVQQIISSTLLRKLGYKVLHRDSPDHRGIDCALVYRSSTMKLKGWRAAHIFDSTGTVIPTRDILVAEFDSLAVLVNHHPSQIGDKSGRRQAAMQTMYSIMDSLTSAGHARIISMGDFNEARWPPLPLGTIRYNGVWEKIDGIYTSGVPGIREEVFSGSPLLTEDKVFGGMKPLRTFSGPRYIGGISDHLPIVVIVNY